MLGVTWDDPDVRVTGRIEARTRAVGSGAWSRWLALDGDSGQGEETAGRGGTEPAWVGPSDGVEVRVVAGDGTASRRLPAGLSLAMIDPDGGAAGAAGAGSGSRNKASGVSGAGGADGGRSAAGSGSRAYGSADSRAGSRADLALDTVAFAADEPSTEPAPGDPDAPADTQSPDPDPGTAPEADPGDGSGSSTGEPTASDAPTAGSTSPAPSSGTGASAGTGSGSATPAPATSSPVAGSPSPTVSVPAGPPSTAPRPAITSRAGWGADESISPEEPGYLPGGKVKAVVVHHTAESNDYTCAQAPAVVRGIYTYHVKTLGWKDVGYNFLVDKCGTVYEGRKGGVDRPVQGAHAYGFNSETTGISVLGTYTTAAPSQAALVSVARIAAWKLGQYGVDPASTATLTAGEAGTNLFRASWAKGAKRSLPAIHGHRDGYNTQCPGDAFYDRLATVRSWAAGPPAAPAITSLGGASAVASTGAGAVGTTYYTKGAVTVNWSTATPAALLTAHEVLVDGQVAAKASATATSAKVTLTPGSHRVAVRAVHQSGKATASTTDTTVVADTTAPTFPVKPSLALRTGTVNTAAVPLTLSWRAADSAALKDVRLTAPLARTYGPAVPSAAHTAASGVATKWSMTAYDQAGNTAAASVSGTPVILQETAAVRTGTWTAKSSGSYLGGKSLTSSSKQASLTWKFTGRSVSWVVSRAATSGQADIYLDGKKVSTVDLKSATTKYRDAIFTQTWSASAAHTLKIVVVGTKDRPAVTTDALVYLK
ncbi:N-acetylmuramoyl-L-alanine amidase [Streptomyces paludis]|nr:N-acetylmuramoyl-L-alanine amidase [Streptomyces paludis]